MMEAGASTNQNRVAGCMGKETFLGPFSAHRMVKRLVRRRKFRHRKGEEIRPYLCATCGQWHIGSAMK